MPYLTEGTLSLQHFRYFHNMTISARKGSDCHFLELTYAMLVLNNPKQKMLVDSTVQNTSRASSSPLYPFEEKRIWERRVCDPKAL